MPMLGKKPFGLAKRLTDIAPGEQIYTIPHTQEQFRSKEEYEKRLELYKQEIWTCQCTGHTTLTHEEALKSEKAAFKTLKSQFPECFEKPVLQIVHHSTDSLDSLNDQAWMKLHQVLAVGEKVNFKVNSCSKSLTGTVVGISSAEATSSNCNSPSSDKENSAEAEEKDKSPKKWTPPKLLPYKYSVRLDEGPTINSVPAQDLARCERPPSKDLVRLFIRSNAVRSGTVATSPWVVREDLVKKYSLPSKFADFLLSPSKMAEAAKRAEEVGKKRKRVTQEGGASKKAKLSDSTEKKKSKKKDKLAPVSLNKKLKSANKKTDVEKQKKAVKKGETTPKKKSPKKKAEVIEVDDSSDDEVSLATIKMKNGSQSDLSDSDSDVPLYLLADQTTPKKKKVSLGAKGASPNKKTKSPGTPKSRKSGDAKSPGTPKTKKSPSKDKKTPTKRKRHDSSDSDVPLIKLSQPGTPKKSPAKLMKEKNEKTPQKKSKTPEKSGEKKGRGRPRKGEEKSPKPGKKGMKQMTLLDLAKKEGKSGSKSPGKSPAKTPKKSPPKAPPTPLIVKKLLQLNKAEDRMKFNVLLRKAVQVLTPTQKKNLPSPLKEKVQKRIDMLEEKKALEKMSESEREEYLKAKKEKQKMKMKEKMLAKMKEMRQRYEDQDLNLQPLPAPKLVPTPENFPNELFGDVTMVTEFISSYSGLLMTESDYPIYTDALMKALAGGPQGFAYLSRVLGVLLQTLLQDQIAEGYRELCVKLRDIAVNPYTASELVRLCLRTDDTGGSRSDEDGEDFEDSEVPEELIQQLETQEFFQLDCQEKLALLRGLCLRIMATYSVQDYMEEKQREAIQLTKQWNTEMKGYMEKKKEKKQKGDEKSASANTSVNGDVPSQDGPAVTITSFYGKKPEDSPADSATESQGEDGDLVSIVKRRRLLAAKAAAEKEKRDLERRLQREKEFQQEREKREREQFETKFKDSIQLARTVLRHSPIGFDRHHNRYWMFTNTTPGLYIEKGWVSQDISYNPGNVPDPRADTDSSSAPPSASSSPAKVPGTPGKKLNLKKKKALVESTVPHSGQNLWFTYTSLKDLDALIKALHPQGIRESALKAEVKKRYNDIVRAIQAAQRNNLELRDSDGQVEMVAGFKKELADIELRLRNGGLGGVPNYSAWEAKLMSAEDIPTMASCMLEMQENILDKFLQGFMKLPRKAEDDDDEKGEENHKEEEEEEGEDGEDADSKEDKKLSAAERRLQQWKDAVENCQTLSRLHVLLSVVDSCIKWEKSAENAKCKICRKKGDDDRLLLCDDCNQAFHMYCLRPQLINVPRGDWFCPACVPQSKRRTQAPKRFADESESESESEEEEMEHNTMCEECGGEAGDDEEMQLVVCHKCPAVYHLSCHEPPLRRMPRGLWECNNCKLGIRNKRNKKRPQRKAAGRKNYRDDSADDSEPAPQSSRSSRHTGRRSGGEKSSSRSTRSSDHRYEEVSQQRSRRAPSDLSMCEDVLKRLMKHPSCWPFLEPVDKKEVPDYHQIIKKPMDFQTMLKKCGRLSYSSPQEFVDDAILVFSNAATYNNPDSEVYNCMKEAEKLFGELLTKYLPSYASTQLLQADNSGDNASARNRRSRRN